MVDAITYRTTDGGRWGAGKGSDLVPAEVDINFWFLYGLVTALQDTTDGIANIDFFNVIGNQMWVHLTNHNVLGPYTLPTAQWNWRGQWTPATAYELFDTFSWNSALYLVTWAHTSEGTFHADAGDGWHSYYALMIDQPLSMFPEGGTVGQHLIKSTGSPDLYEWKSDTRNIGIFVAGTPAANEKLFSYVCPEPMILPAGLTDSAAVNATPPTTQIEYTLKKNGTTIGTINFDNLGVATPVFGADVTFEPGDVFSLYAPVAPDPHQTDISFTFVGTI